MNKNKKVSILNCKYKVYAIGAMENPAQLDGGVGWRRFITPELNSRGIFVFDPTLLESKKTGYTTEKLLQILNTSLENEDFKQFRELMSRVWRGVNKFILDAKTKESTQISLLGDIGYVENSDFLIWHHADQDKPGGTIAELIIAWSKGIPVYLVTDVNPIKMNKSLLYFLLDSGHGEGRIFKNFDKLFKFLDVKYNLKKLK
jgi:hypothetical protein